MIELFLLQALGAIGRQALPPTGCAAFLWARAAQPQLVAMTTPEALTLQLNGKLVVLPRTGAIGDTARGLSTDATYAAGGVSATLAMRVVERPDLADGAVVPEATLTVVQAGSDTIVAPVGGMVGCAPATRN